MEGDINLRLDWTYDEVKERYTKFVNDFMSNEKNVDKKEMLPNFWTVSIPSHNFNVTITCAYEKSTYGFEDWYAVVEETDGTKNNYRLFEEEINEWLKMKRIEKGLSN